MLHCALAIGFAVFIWWMGTGVILYVDGLPKSTFRSSLVAMSALTLAALIGLEVSSHDPSAAGSYQAFTAALIVWSWHEMTFLMGVVTGPRKAPCPPQARGWRRFVYATEVVLHHELALATTSLLLVWLTWGGPNQVGVWTFFVLWVMRLSAKLNIFLGVRNLTAEFIPDHLRYMETYGRKARLNPLMPFSIVLAGAVAAWLFTQSMSVGPSPGAVVAAALVGTLMFLAMLEHVFLAVPGPDAVLWRWALRSHNQRRLAPTDA